uniref:Putative secreted peptide n=1 Tax=Anopheles braziliensis TaxID=58242 RepID=A0A2M3ZQZ6_9DIPT
MQHRRWFRNELQPTAGLQQLCIILIVSNASHACSCGALLDHIRFSLRNDCRRDIHRFRLHRSAGRSRKSHLGKSLEILAPTVDQ